ncbi:MAG: hypothetical protein JJ913_14665 [Rhizobiaceae bacterium]|nr:hypothetical protein [Rhizobiaceae bacterium]
MTRQTSDEIKKLIEKFLRHENLRMEAVRQLDVPKANRHLLKNSEAGEALRSTAEGREALEVLLDEPELHVRVAAAEEVMRWNPDKVIPLFGRLLELDGELSQLDSPEEVGDIRLRARLWLYEHFNIRNADRNELIEPLKAYGVKLKRRDYPQ